MARKHSQDSYSEPDYGYKESTETVYEAERLFAQNKGEVYEDEVYEDESYEEEWEEEEAPKRGLFKGFGRKRKEEPVYEEYEEEYDEDCDEYEEEEEEEKPRFRLFGRKEKKQAEDEYEYGEDYDEYEEEEEEEKPRFRLFGRKEKKRSEDEYESHADSYENDYDEDDDTVSLERVLTMVLGFLMVVALAVSVFAVATLLQSGKTVKKEEAPATEPPAVETMAPTDAELQASGQLAVEATPEPTGTKAVLTAEGILVPGERGPVVPERDTKKSIEEFATVTMIGNSFVEGMKLWSDINCEYVCADGVSLDNMIGNHLYFVTVRDYDAIYLTLGLNEIGWPVDSFISKYEKVIDYIRSDAYSKTATIYITSVMPVEELMETQKAESGQTIKLSTIQTFNEALKEMCQRKGVWYLDVYSALADEKGYLPADIAADDHVHFEKTGYRIWTEYLQNHYVDESLVEG